MECRAVHRDPVDFGSVGYEFAYDGFISAQRCSLQRPRSALQTLRIDVSVILQKESHDFEVVASCRDHQRALIEHGGGRIDTGSLFQQREQLID